MGAGTGMIMCAGVGIIFAPLLGPLGMVFGAGIGLVLGTVVSCPERQVEDFSDTG